MATFPAITTGFSWTPSTTVDSGQAVPAGEAPSGFTVGIRQDGDTAHSAGNYKYLISTANGSISQIQITDPQWVAAKIPPGNYWAAVDQTDMLGTASMTSAWTAEVSFSIPQPIARPDAPTGFTVA